jgi:hypothetical protein
VIIVIGLGYDMRPDGIELDIFPTLDHIGVVVNDDALEAPLEHVSDIFMFVLVETAICQENLLDEPG